MGRKKTELDDKVICGEYLNSNIGVEALATKYHTGKVTVKKILADNGIEIKPKGKQPLREEFVVDDWKKEKYPIEEGFHYIAKAKDGDYETNDYMNAGGHLTSYIKKEFGIVSTLYERRMHYKRTGNYWWEQWFDIVKVADKPIKKCPYCDWTTEDVENRGGAFKTHLLNVHNKSVKDYLSEYPEDIDYFTTATIYTNLEFETNPDNYVVCEICGRKLSHIGGTHLKTHNMSIVDYKAKYKTPMVSKAMHNALSEIAVNTNMNIQPVFHSNAENEIKEFIESLGFECETNRTILKGKEIDLYIPSMKIGFEYDGLRWHNELSKGKNYHRDKTNECRNNFVALYHIFEDEWLFKKELVMSRIRTILGKNEIKIMARKCECRIIDKRTSDEFLNANHMQGTCVSKYNYGLFFENELVAVMTFGNLRKSLGRTTTEGSYELLRFASKLNTTVTGAAGKLLSHFKEDMKGKLKTIITFADKRWSNGMLYINLGFVPTHESSPNYFYIINNRRENRFKYRKSELVKAGFDKNKSEHQIMLERGIYRIYDCGNIVFEMAV